MSQPVNSSGKSISTIAHEVIAGQWGNNPERAKALAAKGYDVAAVQAEVNRILNGSAATTDKKQPADQPIKKTVKATCGARSLDKSLSGTSVSYTHLLPGSTDARSVLFSCSPDLRLRHPDSTQGRAWF